MRYYLKIFVYNNIMATEKIKTFNGIIESFLAQTSEMVGTTYYTYYKSLIKVNSLIAIENSIKFMLPYRDKIFDMDESYFSEEQSLIDKIDETPLANTYTNEKILSEIFRLKNIYYKLDSESKKNIWSILQALVQLTIEYCDIKGIKY